MFDLDTLLVLTPALPLAAAVLTALAGPWLLRGQAHWPTIAALVGSCGLSLLLLVRVHEGAATPPAAGTTGYEHVRELWTWAAIDGARVSAEDDSFTITVALRADPLTAIMLTMVTFVSSLVAIYAAGYMRGDRGYWRFFAYIALFVFSMTALVSVSNFVLLFVFWEAVGACSYLLIGFWYEKPEAAAAGKKAFLVNRVGDFGFALGVFLIWTAYGTLNFHDSGAVAGVLGQSRLASGDFIAGTTGLAICLLLFLGACGKSAQFPLHVWLPDAMEGPTPVSALIHAATMVTAGVYLVARCAPLFVASAAAAAADPTAAWWHDPTLVVAATGGFTALLAGLIAVTQTDLKRVLAYSTVSQLGFMFLGLGAASLAGLEAGMFHLFTHAFFKALLFLGAGSVMHAMGNVIDIRRFSGLRRLMPVTHWTMLLGCLALAGIVPFAGFWSKDEILAAVYARAQGGPAAQAFAVLFWAALGTATLTAFYTFRAFFLTFYGPERVPHEAGHHAHESPAVMTGPLVVLGFCSVVVGAYFTWTGDFAELLGRTPSLAYGPLAAQAAAAHAEHHTGLSHQQLAAISTLAALSGLGAAAFLFLGNRREVDWLSRLLRPLHELSYHKFYLDELYYALVVWPIASIARLCYWFDRRVIDGLVDGIGRLPAAIGGTLRSLQIGLVQFYALAMVLGLLVLIGSLLAAAQ
jgi:NADH-quinone oxidoreductase subunit L